MQKKSAMSAPTESTACTAEIRSAEKGSRALGRGGGAGSALCRVRRGSKKPTLHTAKRCEPKRTIPAAGEENIAAAAPRQNAGPDVEARQAV